LNRESKETCYNNKEAEELELHVSLTQPKLLGQAKPVIQLSTCLDLYISPEILGTDNLWDCPSCKKRQQASKKVDIWSLPPVLMICLKRFSSNKEVSDKIDALVEFPLGKFHD
jgi:ubiquitin C-terminal hydrolase